MLYRSRLRGKRALFAMLPIAAVLIGAPHTSAQGIPTGANIPVRFGASSLLATQTRPTGFGDNSNELNQLFARSDGTNLHIGITGTLSGGNAVAIFLDTKAGGSQTLNYTGEFGGGQVKGRNGSKFDNGFEPDYVLVPNTDGSVLYVDFYDLRTNVGEYLGNSPLNSSSTLSGGNNSIGVSAILDTSISSNPSGVTDADVGPAATATTGLELSVPLSAIGGSEIVNPIRLMVLLENNDGMDTGGGYMSNQFLPGLPDTYGNLGRGSRDFTDIAGTQYATLDVTVTSSDLGLGTASWAYSPVHLTNDFSVDAHPPVTSMPTVFGDKTYVVAYNGRDGILFALGKVDDDDLTGQTNVTRHVAWFKQLDGAVTGRVVVKSVGGVVRLYAQTSKGTVYMMDAVTGLNLRHYNPIIPPDGPAESTTAATPAVVEENGVGTVYATVKNAGTVYLTKFSDTPIPANLHTPMAVTDASDASAPSVIADGTRIQFGVTNSTGGGGRAFTVNTSDMIPQTAASTDGPVLAPPVLSMDVTPPIYLVGDASGRFSAFDVSNANPVWSAVVSGGVSQTAFMDYAASPNVAYFATDSGNLYATEVATGSGLASPLTAPVSGATVTGGVIVVKPAGAEAGNLYLPTSEGLYVLNTDTPDSASRYPLAGVVATPSVGGRATGSLIAVTSGNGAPVPEGVAGTNPAGFAGGNVYGLSAR